MDGNKISWIVGSSGNRLNRLLVLTCPTNTYLVVDKPSIIDHNHQIWYLGTSRVYPLPILNLILLLLLGAFPRWLWCSQSSPSPPVMIDSWHLGCYVFYSGSC